MKSCLSHKNFFVVLVLTALVGLVAQAGAAEPNLVGWWKFDEGSGTIAYDSAGTNHGAIYGAQWIASPIDGALSFDGVNDYVDCGTGPVITGTGTFTTSAWVKTDSTVAGTIVNQRGISHAHGSYMLSVLATGYVQFAVYKSGLGFNFESNVKVNDGLWHHIAAVRTNSTDGEIYVDGSLAGSGSGPARSLLNVPVVIGRWNGGGLYFNGIIDDVRIYDRALSAEEIWQLYWDGLGGKARNPNPANGATGVDPNTALSWSPGKNALSHDVYFGTDYDDVNDATTSSAEYMGWQDVNSWDPCGLEIAQIYYWRIDEVNDFDANSPWKGNVWSFETVRPVIELSATQFEFIAFEGGANPPDQILGISNIGRVTLNWVISEECGWLSVEPNSGSSTGEVDDVNLSVDISGLAAGSYDCNLTISDPNAENSPQAITIALFILPEGALCVPIEYPTIQAAIDAAIDGNVVVVLPGTYTGPGNRDIDFLGKAITVRSESGPENCIIDCNGTKYDPHRGFYFHSREDENSILDGLTITNGFAEKGGGIQCINSSPTITNCTFSRNSAIFISGSNVGGGGMYNQNGSPRLVNCIFTDNTNTYSDGAGMYSTGGRPTLTGCAFTYNLITGNSSGAGMCNKISNAILKDCTFIGNEAHGVNWGGGMVNWESKPTLTNCAFIENWAEDDAGALANFTSEPTLTNCTFIRNRAEKNAGAVLNINKSYAILTNCTFTGNSAGSRGGAIYNPRWHIGDESDITLINCEIVANRAEQGGGILNSGGNSTLVNCTLIANRATYNGGALFGYSCIVDTINCTFASNRAQNGTAVACDSSGLYEPTDLQITNCILWDGGNEIWNNDGSTINIAYSDVHDGWPGASNIDTDPCFVEPGYWDPNGTPEDTGDDFWVEGDYHLSPNSPCIDAGADAGVYDDIEGNVRPFDYPGVDNNGELPEFDMGAYEVVPPPLEVPMKFTPQALNPGSKGRWVKAHFVLPEGYNVEDVNTNTPATIEPMGIESDYMNVFVNEDGFVEIEAAFDRADFCGEATSDDTTEVMVIGLLTSGQNFYGTDTIRIISGNLKYLAVLSYHWLEANCDAPDWCGGADLDQNSVVDFVDFALFDGCCIEVIKE